MQVFVSFEKLWHWCFKHSFPPFCSIFRIVRVLFWVSAPQLLLQFVHKDQPFHLQSTKFSKSKPFKIIDYRQHFAEQNHGPFRWNNTFLLVNATAKRIMGCHAFLVSASSVNASAIATRIINIITFITFVTFSNRIAKCTGGVKCVWKFTTHCIVDLGKPFVLVYYQKNDK